MLELNQQLHNRQKTSTERIGTEFEERRHPRFQKIINKMHARLTHANSEIDRDIFELFCQRMLPVTFHDWTCKL